jgi:predicted HicB family RNase H-like nuclease
MGETLRKDPREQVRQYSEQAKAKQAEMRKKFEEEERLRMEKEYEQYRNYRDATYSDINEKVKQQLNRTADSIANNVRDALKVGEQLKAMWQQFKQNYRK